MNRYASINERLAAQEIADREDGDAIRREAAVDAEEARVNEAIRGLRSDQRLDYAEEFIDNYKLTAAFEQWLFDTVRIDITVD